MTLAPADEAPAVVVPVPDLPAPPAEMAAAPADTTGADTSSDTVGGDTSSDTVSGDTGDDTLSGGEGNDTVAAATVPEAYEIKIKGADGVDADIDADLLAAATPIFKAAGFTNEQAQAVATFYANDVLPGVSNYVQQQTLELLGMADMGEWAKQLQADKEIGGAKYAENMTLVAQGRDAYASEGMRALLETTRLGNHPEFVRHFLKLGKQVAEGKVLNGDQGGVKPFGVESMYDPAFSPKTS